MAYADLTVPMLGSFSVVDLGLASVDAYVGLLGGLLNALFNGTNLANGAANGAVGGAADGTADILPDQVLKTAFSGGYNVLGANISLLALVLALVSSFIGLATGFVSAVNSGNLSFGTLASSGINNGFAQFLNTAHISQSVLKGLGGLMYTP